MVVTYPEDQGSYQHPDHLRVWDITLPAVERARDASYRPELGAPGRSRRSITRCGPGPILARHRAFLDLGLESPYDDSWFERPDKDDQITTKMRSMVYPRPT